MRSSVAGAWSEVMRASEVMTRNVTTIRSDADVRQAVRTMLSERIGGLPVTDADGDLVGIVSEGDFLRRAELGTERQRPRWWKCFVGRGQLAGEYVHSHGRKVSEVMTRDVADVREDSTVAEIVTLMERRRIKRVPVTRGRKIVGMVTRADLLVPLLDRLGAEEFVVRSDAEIHRALLLEVNRRSWAPGSQVHIDVIDGVVHLAGIIDDDRERQALRVAAENLSGVRDVRDRLVLVMPSFESYQL